MPNKTPASRDIDKEKMFRKIMPSAAGAKALAKEGNFAAPQQDEPLEPIETNPGETAIAVDAPLSLTAEAPSVPEAAKAVGQENPFVATEKEPSEPPIAEPSAPENPASGEAPTQEVIHAEAAESLIPPPVAVEESEALPLGDDAMAQAQAADVTIPVPHMETPIPDIMPNLSLDDNADIHPVNVSEVLVERYYPRYQKRLSGCECQRCKDDVYGMALNKVPPRYVRSDQLSEEDLANRSLVTAVASALMKALFAVKRNPHHDDNISMRQ